MQMVGSHLARGYLTGSRKEDFGCDAADPPLELALALSNSSSLHLQTTHHHALRGGFRHLRYRLPRQ